MRFINLLFDRHNVIITNILLLGRVPEKGDLAKKEILDVTLILSQTLPSQIKEAAFLKTASFI